MYYWAKFDVDLLFVKIKNLFGISKLMIFFLLTVLDRCTIVKWHKWIATHNPAKEFVGNFKYCASTSTANFQEPLNCKFFLMGKSKPELEKIKAPHSYDLV